MNNDIKSKKKKIYYVGLTGKSIAHVTNIPDIDGSDSKFQL